MAERSHRAKGTCKLPGRTLGSQCDVADRGNRLKPLRELMAAEETVNHFDLPWRQSGIAPKLAVSLPRGGEIALVSVQIAFCRLQRDGEK
jgi:hypothetical protein